MPDIPKILKTPLQNAWESAELLLYDYMLEPTSSDKSSYADLARQNIFPYLIPIDKTTYCSRTFKQTCQKDGFPQGTVCDPTHRKEGCQPNTCEDSSSVRRRYIHRSSLLPCIETCCRNTSWNSVVIVCNICTKQGWSFRRHDCEIQA